MKRRRPQHQQQQQQQSTLWKNTLSFILLSSILPTLLNSESISSSIILQPLELEKRMKQKNKKIISGVTINPITNNIKSTNRKLPPRQVIFQDYINNDNALSINTSPQMADSNTSDNNNDDTNNNNEGVDVLPIILRPLTSTNEKSLGVLKNHPLLRSSITSSNEENNDGDSTINNLSIFYYNSTNRVENKLPDIVFDGDGHSIAISELLKTNNDILLETVLTMNNKDDSNSDTGHRPPPLPPHLPHYPHEEENKILPLPTLIPLNDLRNKTNGQETNFKPKTNTPAPTIKTTTSTTKNNIVTTTNTTTTKDSNTTTTNTTKQKIKINPSDWEHVAPEAQDQMIIVSTVATMALLVGALSARRLRSRQFLSSCIENESLEDELAYDTAYTTDNGSILGSGRGYDTFSSVPWQGDLEKFDV